MLAGTGDAREKKEDGGTSVLSSVKANENKEHTSVFSNANANSPSV